MPLRYYIYISDAKVDALYAQIDPDGRGKRTTEIGFNLKFFGAKRSRERPVGDDLIGRLARVEDHLRDAHETGSIDEPASFFAGELTMRWGPYGGMPDSPMVYFGGSTERTIVGLGGSSAHVLGSAAPGGSVFSQSATPALVEALHREVADDEDAPADDHADALRGVHIANQTLTGPPQRLGFLAKRLLTGPSPFPQRDEHDDMTVLLGSPIYVAMLD